MDLSSTTSDNLTEMLAKIIEFTERRQSLITQNIVNVNEAGYLPKDLDVTGFAELMTNAVTEHVRNEHLLLRDSANIKFGANGSFESLPIVDEEAKRLFQNDTRKYLKLQLEKLSENLLNNRIATQLLGQKQEQSSALSNIHLD